MKSDKDLEFENHMNKVTKAIEKINKKVDLEQEDIREVFKSLMNAQISISEGFDEQIEELVERFTKLEDFIFRNINRKEDKNGSIHRWNKNSRD